MADDNAMATERSSSPESQLKGSCRESNLEPGKDSSVAQDLKIKIHDVSQSEWIENPNDHSTEKVYLTIEEAPLTEMMTKALSTLCWMRV